MRPRAMQPEPAEVVVVDVAVVHEHRRVPSKTCTAVGLERSHAVDPPFTAMRTMRAEQPAPERVVAGR